MAVKNHIRAAVAAANRNPLIAWPAAVWVVLWAALSVLLMWGTWSYTGEIDFGAFIWNTVGYALLLAGVYVTLLPGIVAWNRKHPSRVAVAWLSLICFIPFLGWIFWIGLMFYAALSQTDRIAPVAYGEGSIVNGHVLRNGQWEKVG